MNHQIEENIFFIALCSAEMKTSTDYEVKLQISCQSREIHKAQCQCPAGVGPVAACKHVSAVLYGVEYYIVTGKPLMVSIIKNKIKMILLGNVKHNPSCTGLLQQWHKPKAAGRNLEKITVNAMLGMGGTNIEPNPAVTNFYFYLFSKGKTKVTKIKYMLCR